MTQTFRKETGAGLRTKIDGISPVIDTAQDCDLYFALDPAYYDVNKREATTSIIPDESGIRNLGSSSGYYQSLYVDNFNVGSGTVLVYSDMLKNGHGISGIYLANNNLYISLSGYAAGESGLIFPRRLPVVYGAQTLAAANVSSYGVFTITQSGTGANPNDNLRMCRQYSTATTFGATAGIGALVNQTGIRPQDNPSLRFDVKIMLIAAGRINMGFLNMQPGMSGYTDLAGDSRLQGVWIHYGSGLGGWKFITKDNAGATATDFTVEMSNQQWHDVHIYTDNRGASWKLNVNGIPRAEHSTHLPQSGIPYGVLLQVANTSPVTCRFRTSYLNCVVNSPNPTEYII